MTSELHNSRFLRAVRGEPTDTVPVWIMRQAGRYLPEYMAVRSKVTFMELCKTPSLAAEVTVTAQQVLGVDAAILFADLLPILQPMGFDLEYAKGEGPVIHNPLTSAAEVDRVRPIEDFSVFEYVYEAVRLIRRELAPNIPLLGFAGAPFTLASYAIEGGGLQELHPHQDVDVDRPRGVGRAPLSARDERRRLPPEAGGKRLPGGSDLR